MKEKFKKAWVWLRREILNKDMLLWIIIAELIFWSPCITGVILAVAVNSWFWSIPTVYIAFWAGPFTPAIPIQLGLAFGLKKITCAAKRRKAKKNRASKSNESTGREQGEQ